MLYIFVIINSMYMKAHTLNITLYTHYLTQYLTFQRMLTLCCKDRSAQRKPVIPKTFIFDLL